MALFGIGKRELRIFLERSLSKREQQLLLEAYILQGLTFSMAVSKLSAKCPESTAKLVLKRLKEFGFVEFGSVEHKCKSLSLTALGEIVCEILRGDLNGRI